MYVETAIRHKIGKITKKLKRKWNVKEFVAANNATTCYGIKLTDMDLEQIGDVMKFTVWHTPVDKRPEFCTKYLQEIKVN